MVYVKQIIFVLFIAFHVEAIASDNTILYLFVKDKESEINGELLSTWIIEPQEWDYSLMRCVNIGVELDQSKAKVHHKKLLNQQIQATQRNLADRDISGSENSKRKHHIFIRKSAKEYIRYLQKKISEIESYRYHLECIKPSNEPELKKLMKL